jgi:hypothetical protein
VPATVEQVSGCPECGFAFVEVESDPASGLEVWRYEEGRFESAPQSIDALCGQITEILRSPVEGDRLTLSSTPGRWTPLEYACHVRDALLLQRERVLKALRGHGDEFLPMGREERAVHDGYNEQDPHNVALQLEQAALLFSGLLRRLSPPDWDLEVAYVFPEASLRSLRWIAVHTEHEAIHHLHDMKGRPGDS